MKNVLATFGLLAIVGMTLAAGFQTDDFAPQQPVPVPGTVGPVKPVEVINVPLPVEGSVGIAGPVTVEGVVGVEGPVAVTGTVTLDAPVAVAGAVEVTNLADVQVGGAVEVTNLPSSPSQTLNPLPMTQTGTGHFESAPFDTSEHRHITVQNDSCGRIDVRFRLSPDLPFETHGQECYGYQITNCPVIAREAMVYVWTGSCGYEIPPDSHVYLYN